jgi:hypothetical protein
MLKSCVLTMTMDNYRPPESQERSPAELNEANVFIHAHYADGHIATRNSQVKLLEELASMAWGGQTRRESFLQQATVFSLTAYVQNTLASLGPDQARQTAAKLLYDLYSSASIPFPPFATARIVRSLIDFGAIPRTDFSSDDPRRWGPWLAIISRIPNNLKTPPDLVISIIKEFLWAGADPTITVRYWFPSSPHPRTGTLKEIIVEYLCPASSEDAAALLVVFEESLQVWKSGSPSCHEQSLTMKRQAADAENDLHPSKSRRRSSIS